MTIDVAIDLRESHGATRCQGSRPTCLAFALSDLTGHGHQRPALLSPEFLYREAAGRMSGWRPGDGLDVHVALHVAAAPGQALDAHCPYEPSEPSVPLVPNAHCTPMFRGTYAARRPEIDYIAQTLSVGRSLGLVVNLTPEFFQVDPATALVSYSPNVMPGSSHALVVVGLGAHVHTQELHVLVRNSWGPTWGDNGHAWLSENYIATHGILAFGG